LRLALTDRDFVKAVSQIDVINKQAYLFAEVDSRPSQKFPQDNTSVHSTTQYLTLGKHKRKLKTMKEDTVRQRRSS